MKHTRPVPPTGPNDAALLHAFVSERDEESFAELVRRYTPLVFEACRRVLTHDCDAEDAFQATFLFLARKADHIDRPSALPGWLYRVAVRASLALREARDRRSRREQLSAEPPEGAVDPPEPADWQAALNEELERLPEKYRNALLMCVLRGFSHQEAASRLGCPPGSMSWRLEKARQLLKAALLRRGLAPEVMAPVIALSTALAARALDLALRAVGAPPLARRWAEPLAEFLTAD
jgi:RNA polymerase sigma factor (sigma-70 family)